ncbi:21898_t:CDS:2 [Dentiscutata erythropus]|uniref:21898_t:CDS:1 n=1 Tax=Dentiscutata erythropus TaxID=1348616 RepID=A0A9N9EBN4_9GLOM|nr:21898_t:CDS:2 [Dentiscutata erythropus]
MKLCGIYKLQGSNRVKYSNQTNENEKHIDLSKPTKNNPNLYVFVTTFENKYNHEMCSEILQFEKLKAFTNEIKENTEFYVKECNFGATIIRQIF